MTEKAAVNIFETYLNPVFPHSFPDPFVLKFRNEYYAYCTGIWSDEKVFGVLHSRDLVNWTEVGGAMRRLETDAPFYWAPEVTYWSGKFYLYYSVGNETLMEIRVAVSDRPDGGFVDSGHQLTSEDFAIDAHVFTDDDGKRYLFYATDFLEHTHIGTGTVVDKMIDFFTLEGSPRPVTRAKYDWQIYDPQRKEKGGVRWHTVEGAFVLKRKGIYYEMFSGGNWQNVSYGVSFAITDNIDRDEEWIQFSDGEKVLPILRTLPDLVVGPGHNSVIRGVNNREIFCIYHRWTEHGRVLAIDRMDFAGTRIFIKGASYMPQPLPFRPTLADFFDGENLEENWRTTGRWTISDGKAICEIAEKSELVCRQTAESFLCEVSLRAAQTIDENGAFGFCLLNGQEKTLEFLIYPNQKKAIVFWFENGERQKQIFELSKDFAASDFHLLRVEADAFCVKFSLDEIALYFEKLLKKKSTQIALLAEQVQAEFSGFALTEGFEDLFEWQNSDFNKCGWEKLTHAGAIRVGNGELFLSSQSDSEAILSKGSFYENFEYAVNVRLVETFDENSAFGFLLLNQNAKIISRFEVEVSEGKFYLTDEKKSLKFSLPESFAPENYHQFRFFKVREKIVLQLEEIIVGELSAPESKVRIDLFCQNSTVAFEMVRLTVL